MKNNRKGAVVDKRGISRISNDPKQTKTTAIFTLNEDNDSVFGCAVTAFDRTECLLIDLSENYIEYSKFVPGDRRTYEEQLDDLRANYTMKARTNLSNIPEHIQNIAGEMFFAYSFSITHFFQNDKIEISTWIEEFSFDPESDVYMELLDLLQQTKSLILQALQK